MKQLFFRIFLAALLAGPLGQTPVTAQIMQWIQVEARPSLREAQTRTRTYAARFDNVSGFATSSGWYAIVLGPFAPETAGQRLRQLKRDRLIPPDSFIAAGGNFQRQFWPIGARTRPPLPGLPTETKPQPIAQTSAQEPAPEQRLAPAPDETPRHETPQQARAGEALLSPQARKSLQQALQWAGFYDAAVDGAFGRGTRAAMRAWQIARGHVPTGVLTTAQRRQLLDSYNAVLAGTGLKMQRNIAAGIAMKIPTALVEFAKYDPPFVHYASKPGSRVQLFLISQNGGQADLSGLYDILQTLKIIPAKGSRARKKSSFEITGTNAQTQSYAYGALRDGMIKGFILVWPAGDARRRDRVLSEMRASFTPIGTSALDQTLGQPDETQRVDLLAGLEIRQPARARSGFYVDDKGTVLTTSGAVRDCAKITLERDYDARVILLRDDLGLALLRPDPALTPAAFATFRRPPGRLKSEIAVAGYSFQGALDGPTLTYGTLADIRGLHGEQDLQRLDITVQPGDAGGPVFDAAGLVQGLLLARPDTSRQRLPEDVNFARKASALIPLLRDSGIAIQQAAPPNPLPAEDLTTRAAKMTVLVRCWK